MNKWTLQISSDSNNCKRDPENKQQLTGEKNVNFILSVQPTFRSCYQSFYV